MRSERYDGERRAGEASRITGVSTVAVKLGDIIPISAIPWFPGFVKVADAMLDQGIV